MTNYTERSYGFLNSAAHAARGWYDCEGNWTAASTPAITRERFWICFALYSSGFDTLGDHVIRKGETDAFEHNRFNIFDTNIAAALLVQCADEMAADVRAKLADLVRDGFHFKPGNRQPDYQFHGYNDNMPAKATMGLILGGELLGGPDAVEHGLWNLRQCRAMLVRRGINSEFNSPTYSPMTIRAMAAIAESAKNAEARELARKIEARLWIDLAARFHPEIGVLSGPSARSYTVDMIAHLSSAASLLWFLLGDRSRPSPMELFNPNADLVWHHEGDVPFNIASAAYLAAGHYHVPDLAMEMFEKKQYPFRAQATFELGDDGTDIPARPGHITTLLTEDFSLGTATTPYFGGEQSMCYFAMYRRSRNVRSYHDVGTIYHTHLLDDDVPGMTRQTGFSNSGEASLVASQCNTIAFQSGKTALVLTHPRLSIAQSEGVRAVSDMVVFPAHFAGVDEICVGGESRDSWSGIAEHGEWIVCRRGRLMIGIRPMAYSRLFGHAQVTLERLNKYDVIRATLYGGERRKFERAELAHMFGGFIAEHAGVDEYPSLSAFAEQLAESQFTDYFWTTRRVRYRRANLDIECSASPGAMAPRYVTINGRPLDMPTLQIDGVNSDKLPFLDEPFSPVPSFFPWQDFVVQWGAWPFAIGDPERQ